MLDSSSRFFIYPLESLSLPLYHLSRHGVAPLDDPDLELIIQLQLDDLQSLITDNESRETDDDGGAALETYRAELRALASNRAFCQHIANGGEPANYLAPGHTTATVATDDQASSNGQDSPDTGNTTPSCSSSDHIPNVSLCEEQRKATRRLDLLTVNEEEEDIYSPPGEEKTSTGLSNHNFTVAGSTKNDDNESAYSIVQKEGTAASNASLYDELASMDIDDSRDNIIEYRQCLACLEKLPTMELAVCPCSHAYCGECLGSVFEKAMEDESFFPPRCCRQAIPFNDHRDVLPDHLVENFEAKELEYSTPNRTYCHQPTCSAFISGLVDDDVVMCLDCCAETCTTCKGAAHRGMDCPEDLGTIEILEFARENGWQRCYSCQCMVELDTGCNHISELSPPLRNSVVFYSFRTVTDSLIDSLQMPGRVLLSVR